MGIDSLFSKVSQKFCQDGMSRLGVSADRAASAEVSDTARKTAGAVFGHDNFIRRAPIDDLAKGGGGAQRQLFANAATEAKDPAAFALSPQSADFRQALATSIDPNRQKFIQALQGNQEIMGKFNNWETLSADDKVATLKQVGDLQGQVMGFTPPPMVTKPGVPQGGTLGFFAPDPQGGLGSVTLFPDAMAKTDKWTPLVTVTHEMEHAHQDQIVKAGMAGKFAAGSPEDTLAKSFSAADQGIEQVGGESNLAYGDYAHLNNEFDSFRFGNSVGKVVSGGEANTSALGFVDAQFDAHGNPMLDLNQLAQQVGPNNLLDAVNQKEQAFIQSLQQKTA